MNKVIKKVELTDEEQAERIERKKAERRDIFEDKGKIYLDEKYKEPGKHYRLVNLTSGNVEYWERFGGEVLRAPISMGDSSSADTNSTVNTAVEVEVGGPINGSQKAVWMVFSAEDYQIWRDLEDEKAKAQDETLGHLDIPNEYVIGKVTREK